jgi:hypothetical protein
LATYEYRDSRRADVFLEDDGRITYTAKAAITVDLFYGPIPEAKAKSYA